jgi:hypothetical protein
MSLDIEAYNEAHRATWINFVKLTVYASVGVVGILVLLAIFVL